MLSENRLNRDLAWCLGSASLAADESWCEFAAPLPAGLTLAPPPDVHRFRLGRHFELLLRAWMDASNEIELIEANLPVRQGKQTVGEFDFLVRFRGEVEHWEAAVKFYLGTGDRTNAANWFGPNTADRLDLKLDRLRSHQLRLAEHPAAREMLAERGIQVARSRCLMKGRLFHPAGADREQPPSVNPAHEHGWWLTATAFASRFAGTDARFAVLPKALWLAPLASGDVEATLSADQLLARLAQPRAEQATHVAMIADEGEVSRGFIVTDQWLTRVNA